MGSRLDESVGPSCVWVVAAEPIVMSRTSNPPSARSRVGEGGRSRSRAGSAPLGLAAMLMMAVGVGAGLARMGWGVPDAFAFRAALHGVLMIGFFGTVIGLERAVALGSGWPYLAPLASACGGLVLCLATPGTAGAGLPLLLVGGAILLLASFEAWRRQPAVHTLILALGAFAWIAGNAVWGSGQGAVMAMPWWIAFLVLTIAGERLELSRVMRPPPQATLAFVAIVSLLLFGLAWQTWITAGGTRIYAVSLLLLAGWLFRYDVARRTIRMQGLTRYIAACLLAGYVWLAFGAAAMLAVPQLQAGSPAYDIAVHSILLGFVFSMVMGHAPIILPAVARVKIRFHRAWYAAPTLLHLSLTLRVGADLSGQAGLRKAAALMNALAIGLFLLIVLSSLGRRGREPAQC